MSGPRAGKPRQPGQLILVGGVATKLDAALSPQGDRVATLDGYGALTMRALWSSEPLWTAAAAKAGGVAFLGQGRTLLTVGFEGLAETWDAATGARLGAWATQGGPARFNSSLVPSPGERWLLRFDPGSDKQQVLALADLTRPAPLLRLGRGTQPLFTPEDDACVAAVDGALVERSLPGFAVRSHTPVRGLEQLLAFSPDGGTLRVLARVASKRPRLRVQTLSWPGLEVQAEHPLFAKVHTARELRPTPRLLSPDGARLVALGPEGSEEVRVIDLATGEVAPEVPRHLLPSPRLGRFTPDGLTLLGLEWGGCVRLMDLRSPAQRAARDPAVER